MSDAPTAADLPAPPCPVRSCTGKLQPHWTEPANRSRLHCPDCRVEFRFGTPDPAGVANMDSLQFTTYQGEAVEAGVTVGCWAVRVRGRLDLFAGELLERLWLTLPQPLCVLLDLSGTTEFTSGGTEILAQLMPTAERLAVVVGTGAGGPDRSLFPDTVVVTTDPAAAAQVFADRAEPMTPWRMIVGTPPAPSPTVPPPPATTTSARPTGHRRRLEVEDIGDVTVVNFVDKKIIDEKNVQIIGEQLFALVDEEGRRKILLNFGNVEYFSSAALGKLITLNRKLQAVRGKLILCNIDPSVVEVFEITRLTKLFTIRREEQEALQCF